MNIKLSKNEVRVRINRGEATSLLSGEVIFFDIAIFSDKTFTLEVRIQDNLNTKLSLSSNQSIITLFVSRQALLDLEKLLPSRSGIEESWVDYQEKSMTLSLEVDIKNR